MGLVEDGFEVDGDDTIVDTGALSVSGEARKLNSAITGYVRTSDRAKGWLTHGNFWSLVCNQHSNA
jgi:hypothetical protein